MWLDRSLDLIPSDLFLWSYLEVEVHLFEGSKKTEGSHMRWHRHNQAEQLERVIPNWRNRLNEWIRKHARRLDDKISETGMALSVENLGIQIFL